MIKYKKEFLDKIKILLSYFVEFNENKSILPKKYYKNYIIKTLNWKPIIIIKYYKSIFLTNNSCWKV